MTKIEAIDRLTTNTQNLLQTAGGIPEHLRFATKSEKWSPAEHIMHLNLSVKPLELAYRLPGFLLAWKFGRANRMSRTYDELLNKYRLKLDSGGKAPSAFIPETHHRTFEEITGEFRQRHHHLIQLAGHWSEKKLDTYILPHPLLGKLTLREMLYFTALHIHHHEQLIIRQYLNP